MVDFRINWTFTLAQTKSYATEMSTYFCGFPQETSPAQNG